MSNGKQSDRDIFTVIRETHPLSEYCENNGIHFLSIGTTYRARSPFTDALNAFSVNKSNPDIWHDFSVTDKPNHGDVVELCALLEHDGDIRAALMQLAPEGYSRKIDKGIKEKQAEQEHIARAHTILLDNKYPTISHYAEYLHSRGVDDAQIRRAKLGVSVEGGSFRLLIPRFNYDGVEVLYHKTRRMPDSEGHEIDTEPRYKNAYIGSNSFLRYVPLGLQTLSKQGRFLVLCEGDFDTLNFEREGFAVLGSGGGVFNHDAWPDILSNAENFNEVVLAFDNDEAGASYTLTVARNLFQHRIPFRVISLPEHCKDVNDFYRAGGNLQALIDDATPGFEYLALSFVPAGGFNSLTRGKKRALQENLKDFLIQAKYRGADNSDIVALCLSVSDAGAIPQAWLAEVFEQVKKGQPEAEIVEVIRQQHTLLFNERTGFCEYNADAGIWARIDDTVIGEYIRAYLGSTSNARKIHAVIDHLKIAVVSDAPVTKFNRMPLFAFRNGTLHYNGEGNTILDLLKPASPDDFTTSRKSFDFDPKATCPEWERAVDLCMAGDDKRVMCFQEYCGYALLPHCKYHKALYMRGAGRNGKSTLLNVIRALFGDDNTTCLEPSDFASAFSLIHLKDALINICTDAKPDITGAEANLKKAIAGEPLQACYKLKDYITFRPRAKIFFACNHDLATKDKTDSMLERFLLIDFPVHFVDNPQEGTNEAKKDLDIEAKLMQELSGVFNWCMEGARRLINQGHFTITDEQAEIARVFAANTDSVIAFLDDFKQAIDDNIAEHDGRDFYLTRGQVYACYLDFCDNEGISKPLDVRVFHKLFKKALDARHIPYNVKKTHEGTRYYVF